jgi:hypothetical protein
VLACRILGHRFQFRAEGSAMHWTCTRGCGAGGSKSYGSAAEASRYALGLERAARPPGDGRAPFIALLPLRLLRRARRSRSGG